MKNSKPIVDAINSALKILDFKKKSNTWYLHRDETVLLVNLQKSQYGDQFYINCAVLVRALSNLEFPKEYACHIRFRLDSDEVGAPKKRIELLLDLENDSISDAERKAELEKLIANHALPFLNQCSTLNEIAEMVRDGKIKSSFILKDLADLISGLKH
jgi:Domain of unknown function (DUF4304)